MEGHSKKSLLEDLKMQRKQLKLDEMDKWRISQKIPPELKRNINQDTTHTKEL